MGGDVGLNLWFGYKMDTREQMDYMVKDIMVQPLKHSDAYMRQ